MSSMRLPNCYRFGIFIDGQLVSTLRIHHVSAEDPFGADASRSSAMC